MDTCSGSLMNDSSTSQEWRDRSFRFWVSNPNAENVTSLMGYIALAVAGVRMAFELAQFFAKPWKYVTSMTNWCELITYIGAGLVIIPFYPYTSACGMRSDWQWEVGVIALIMSWIVLLLFIQSCEHETHIFSNAQS